MDRVVLGCTAAILVRALLLQEAASSTIRVEPGHGNTRGRLQVFHDGIWGTVCDDSFGNPDARVACRALGINSKYAVPWNFGPGSGSILLDDLACHGTEESLDDCLHNVWGDHECEHSEDTGVICTDDEVMVTPTNVPVLVSDGDQVNFTCLALGNMGRPFRYHWFSGIQHSTDCGDTRVHQRLPDTLIISNGSDLGSSTANIGVQYREKPDELSLADTSSSSCSHIRQTYIVGGSLRFIVLALMGLVLLMLIRQHNPSAEKKSTEGDMVQDCTNQYYLHCVPRDQKNLSLSTCDNSCSRAEYPAVNVSRSDKHCQPHDTVDEHGDEPHFIELETLMEAHDYEIV